ncbi:MAG: ribose 5-phosphate isomerase A [Thermoplasmata archaeon]
MEGNMDSIMRAKIAAAEAAVRYVEDGMIVGLGTGSTAEIFVRKLCERIKREGISISGVTTSRKTSILAEEMGIKIIEIDKETEIDLTVDGADEVAPDLTLIKGMGGALLWEKIVAKMSRKVYIVVDYTKRVRFLGEKSPLPVEIVPYGWKKTQSVLENMFGCTAEIRKKNGSIFLSDSGNYILDCRFQKIENPEKIEKEIKGITGVVESGLFCKLATKVLIGKDDGKVDEVNMGKQLDYL